MSDTRFDAIDKQLERLDKKFDKIDDRLNSIDKTLVEQHESLKTHIKRSDAIEKRVEQINAEIKPVLFHVQFVNLLGKILLVILGSELSWEVFKYIVLKN